jgi:hypothetical protein
MNNEIKCCAGGCGFSADKSTMHYRPEFVNGFKREWYYCDKCNEKRFHLLKLKATSQRVRKQLHSNTRRSHQHY